MQHGAQSLFLRGLGATRRTFDRKAAFAIENFEVLRLLFIRSFVFSLLDVVAHPLTFVSPVVQLAQMESSEATKKQAQVLYFCRLAT